MSEIQIVYIHSLGFGEYKRENDIEEVSVMELECIKHETY